MESFGATRATSPPRHRFITSAETFQFLRSFDGWEDLPTAGHGVFCTACAAEVSARKNKWNLRNTSAGRMRMQLLHEEHLMRAFEADLRKFSLLNAPPEHLARFGNPLERL